MKDFVLLFGVFLAIIIGVGWFLLPAPARDLLHRSTITVQADDTEQLAPPPPAPPPRAKIRQAGLVETSADLQPPLAPVRPPRQEPVVALPPSVSARVPYPWEVLPGEEKSE